MFDLCTIDRTGQTSCLVDRISDTLSQGYTNLQSLVKCLDHAQYAVKQGCVRLRDALTDQLQIPMSTICITYNSGTTYCTSVDILS